MLLRFVAVAALLASTSAAHATVLRVGAEPPLSAERLGDALRSYIEGAEVKIVSGADGPAAEDGVPMAPGTVGVTLRGNPTVGEDVEVVVVDGEETILARLPGAPRSADLYRAAALKVQSLLQRRATIPGARQPDMVANTGVATRTSSSVIRDRVWLDTGLAFMVPTSGLLREGLRLGVGLRPAARLRLGLGAYLEPRQATTTTQGVDVAAWELPFWLSLGFAWHQGRWQGWLDAVGQAALRRVSAASAEIPSRADTAMALRAGGALAIGLPLGPALRAELRASLLATVVDARYRVDGQVVWPAAPALGLVELGLAYGVR